MKSLGDDHRGHAQGQPDEKQRQEPADPFLPRDLEDAQGGHEIALRGDEDVGLPGDADQLPEGCQDGHGHRGLAAPRRDDEVKQVLHEVDADAKKQILMFPTGSGRYPESAPRRSKRPMASGVYRRDPPVSRTGEFAFSRRTLRLNSESRLPIAKRLYRRRRIVVMHAAILAERAIRPIPSSLEIDKHQGQLGEAKRKARGGKVVIQYEL